MQQRQPLASAPTSGSPRRDSGWQVPSKDNAVGGGAAGLDQELGVGAHYVVSSATPEGKDPAVQSGAKEGREGGAEEDGENAKEEEEDVPPPPPPPPPRRVDKHLIPFEGTS